MAPATWRWSTVSIQTWIKVLVKPLAWAVAIDVPSTPLAPISMRPAVGHLRSSTIRIRTSRRSRFGPAAYRLYAVSSWPCAIQLVQIAIRTHDSRAHVWTECADCTGRHADGLLRLSSGGCPKSCAGALVRTTSTCRHTSDVTDGEREEVVGCRARGSHRADVFKPRSAVSY